MGYSFNKLTNNIVPKGTYKAVIREVSFKTSASGKMIQLLDYLLQKVHMIKRI